MTKKSFACSIALKKQLGFAKKKKNSHITNKKQVVLIFWRIKVLERKLSRKFHKKKKRKKLVLNGLSSVFVSIKCNLSSCNWASFSALLLYEYKRISIGFEFQRFPS